MKSIDATSSLFQFQLETRTRVDFVDITPQVEQAIGQRKLKSGICVVYCPHTTAAITINENADPDVPRDMGMALGKIAPRSWEYRHSEGNSDSHIQTSLVGPSITLIVHDSRLLLGTWQGVFFCDFDGPRERKFYVKTISDVIE